MTRQEYSLAYDSGYKLTVGFLLSRGSSGETAEEAAQAAWAKGWECRDSLRNPTMVVSWVNTIALNLFRNGFRSQRWFKPLTEMPTCPTTGVESIDLDRILQKSDLKDRDLLEQHYLEGYTSEEIAEKIGCTSVAVRVRILRARRRLYQRLKPKRNTSYRPNIRPY
jgi:RNA polymerase sigma factor (sigma-70 family)